MDKQNVKYPSGLEKKSNGKKWVIAIGIIILFGILSSAFQPSPVLFTKQQEKYIGDWIGDGIILSIFDNSYIDYKKEKNGVKTSVSGPIVEFNDNNFKISVGFFKTTFIINKEPLLEGSQYKMIIDGNKLTRKLTSNDLLIPEIGDLKKLTNDFFTLFNNSVFKDDYKLFYNSISKFWQGQTSEDNLKKALSGQSKYDLENIMKNDIVFSKPPYLDDNNLLILEGYYADKLPLNFTLKFIYEHPKWKIVGFKF